MLINRKQEGSSPSPHIQKAIGNSAPLHETPSGSRYLRMNRVSYALLFKEIFSAVYAGKYGPSDIGSFANLRKEIEEAVGSNECSPETIRALSARLSQYITHKDLATPSENAVYGQMTNLLNGAINSTKMFLTMAKNNEKAKAMLLEGLESLDRLFEMYSQISYGNSWIADCIMGTSSARDAVEMWKNGPPAVTLPAASAPAERMSQEYLATAAEYMAYMNEQMAPAKESMLELLYIFKDWADELPNSTVARDSMINEAQRYDKMLACRMRDMRNAIQTAQPGLKLGAPEKEVNARIFQDYLTSTLGCTATGHLIKAIENGDLASTNRRAHIIALEIDRAFRLFEVLDGITESRMKTLLESNYIGRALKQIEKNEAAQP